MKIDTAQEAISSALKGDWVKAIELNQKILKDDSKDVEALNRLARAYSETGRAKDAIKTAQRVLEIDPFNTIAAKCVQKWKIAKPNGKRSQAPKDPKTFLEEPGKTKITSLLNLGDDKTVASLDTGDELALNAGQHRISVITVNGNYVGRLADDISARLRRLIRMGNKYEVLVKSSDKNSVKVLIRETERVDSLRDTPSFPTEKIEYSSFTPPELVHRKSAVYAMDEE